MITDLRVNENSELEGKVETPQWDEMYYTKDDLVTMLEELQSEIREYHEIGCNEDCNNCRMVGCVEPVNVIKDLDIIQQKINLLKAVDNENSNRDR